MPGGRPIEVSREDVLEVFQGLEDPAEPLTAPEIAERLDCSPDTARTKLQHLAAQDKLATKKVGARARVFWRPAAAARDG